MSPRLAVLLWLCMTGCGCAGVPDAVPTALPPPVALGPDAVTFELGPKELDVEVDVSAVTTYTLRFKAVRGTLTASRHEVKSFRIDLAVETASLDARIAAVADIAKSEFLHTDRFPTASFESRVSRPSEDSDEELDVFGELFVHGVRKPIRVPARVVEERCMLLVSTEFALDRHDFGIESPSALDSLVEDQVTVRVDAHVPWTGARTCKSPR